MQGTHNPLVAGSSPAGPTTFKGKHMGVVFGFILFAAFWITVGLVTVFPRIKVSVLLLTPVLIIGTIVYIINRF